MKSGAPLAFVCWQTPAKTSGIVWLWRRQRSFEMPAAPEPRAPARLPLRNRLCDLHLTDAGFGDIVIEPHTQTVELFSGQDVRDAAENFAHQPDYFCLYDRGRRR